MKDSKKAKEERVAEVDKSTILNSITELVAYQDRELRVIWANKAAASAVGKTVEQLIGKHCYEIWPQRTTPCVGCPLLEVLKSGKPESGEMTTPDGRMWLISGYPVRDKKDDLVGAIEIMLDITERKRAEEELQRSYDTLNTINTVLHLSLENRPLEETLEHTLIALLSVPWLALESKGSIFLVEDDPEVLVMKAQYNLEEPIQRACALVPFGRCLCGRAALTKEIQFADCLDECHGTTYEGITNHGHYCVPILCAGRTLGVINLYLKEGHRHKQSEVDFLNAVANTLVGIIQREKAEAGRRELEQKAQVASRLASVGEMASGIAHEINNPLTGVVGFSELLMTKDLPEDIRKDVEIIHDGSQRVAGIVKGLLTFARQHKPERTYTDINEVIESTITLRKYSLETGNIEVNTSLDAELPGTMADAGQLQQVFMNIIVNAESEMRKAHGRGKLTIKTEQIDNTIRLSFKDDGPGIAKENIGKVFNPFFTTREVGEGTGLGLSLSYGIIAEHKGALYVKSRLGKGATFFIELPIIAEEKQLGLAEPADEVKGVSGGRILVVDDEPTILAFLKKVLGGEGYDVATASSGEEALKKIKSERYGLILCDIKLPGLSGAEIYEQIEKVAPSLQKRVMFITGDVTSTDTEAFLKKARSPYVTKPFDIVELRKEVKRVIAGAG